MYIFYGQFFHFSDEAVKGARRRCGKPRAWPTHAQQPWGCHACLGQASVSLGAPRMPTNLLHHGPQNRIQKTSRNMAARKGPRLYKKQSGTHREKKHVLTLTLMLVRRKSACKTSAGSSKILRWLTPLLGPNLDPKTGPKQRPKRRNENVIQFWTPFWGPYLDPKMGSAIGEFRCCPHMLCKQICDPAAWTWMSTPPFFSLCVPSPVATVQETKWDAQREKACINTYAHASASQICLQNLCGQQQNSPMADPTWIPKRGPSKDLKEGMKMWSSSGPHFGSKSGSQNGAQAKT